MSLMCSLPPGEELAGGEYLYDFCPNCGKERHFYWNLFKNVGHCKVCDFRPRGTPPGEDNDFVDYTPRQISVNKDMIGQKLQSPWIDTDARQFLKSRGVTLEQCKKFHIKHNIDRNCLEVPVSPVAPEYPAASFVRFHRSFGSKWMPNGVPKLHYMFNAPILENRKSVLVCEGIFDVLTAKVEDISVALLGTQITDRMLDLLCTHKVFTWFDWDDAGMAAAQKMQELGRIWGFTVMDLTAIIQAAPKEYNPELNDKTKAVITTVREMVENGA